MTWDLSSYFPEFNGREMVEFKQSLDRDIAALCAKAALLPALAPDTEAGWEEVLLEYEAIQKRISHLGSYLSCLAAADARNEAYLKESAALARKRAEFVKLRVELFRAVRECHDEAFSTLIARPNLRGARHYLLRLREESQRSMNREKEGLAADLAVDGIQAWGRLYDTLSGKLEFEMVFADGRRERLPMAQRRSLLEHADRRIRKAAFDGGNEAWKTVADTAAAALNAIAGTRLTLNRHRGVGDFLEPALFQAGITKETLDAMLAAVFAEIELPRRILRLKARLMGADTVAWYDLGAPLPLAQQTRLAWEEARTVVRESFARAYPRLGEFFQSVVERNWIDWEARPGKRPGAFCTGSPLTRESRIFMTYNEAFGDVLTLAHESGHAFHNHIMRDLRPFQRSYPMTLAETASTFGELILLESRLEDPALNNTEKALLLDLEIAHAAVYLLDIPVRYEFEKAFYEERARGEVSVSRLRELMVDTQRRVLGPVLEPGEEDPYFWASKLHFYIAGTTFYNFPYSFGFLLSRALFTLFRRVGNDFLPRYEDFLRLAGSDTVENVARGAIGQDVRSADFWRYAISSLEEPLQRLETLLPEVQPLLSR